MGFGLKVPSDDVARVRFVIPAPGVAGAVGGDDCVGCKREAEGVSQVGAAKTYAALAHLANGVDDIVRGNGQVPNLNFQRYNI